MSTISALISTVNGSVIEGGATFTFPIDDIYIIQRDGIGSVITYNGSKYFTTTPIDLLTGSGLVMATALAVNGSLQPSPLKIAFPSAKAIVTKCSLYGSNSAVAFFGNIYYVSETQADILAASATSTTQTVQLPVFQNKITLTDAQIKALPTTPIELVAAKGVNKLISVLSCDIVFDNAAGVYTNADSAALALIINGAYVSGLSTIQQIEQAYDGTVGKWTYRLPIPGVFIQNGAPDVEALYVDSILNAQISNPFADLTNQALFIKDTQSDWAGSATDYTGGNVANRCVISVIYTIVDLS